MRDGGVMSGDVAARVRRAGLRVAVLCGGPGGEREVSLASGDEVHRALLRAGLDNEKIIVPEDNPGGFLESVDCGLAVVIMHGAFGEDGTAQAILERRGIAFTGSDSRACALSMDKDACKRIFAAHSIPTQPWIVAERPEGVLDAVSGAGLRFPVFVKPNCGGSSVATSRVDTPERLEEAVQAALAADRKALVEEMVKGRELTVGWLDGEVLPVIEMTADGAFYDYHAKYLSAATRYVCPAGLPERTAAEVAETAGKVARLLGARDMCRVDIMLGDDGPRVLEMNAIPGFTSHSLLPRASRAAGIGMEELCLRLVALALARIGR